MSEDIFFEKIDSYVQLSKAKEYGLSDWGKGNNVLGLWSLERRQRLKGPIAKLFTEPSLQDAEAAVYSSLETSPDGSLLAVTYDYPPLISILRVRDNCCELLAEHPLHELRSAQISGNIPVQARFILTWSQDSKLLAVADPGAHVHVFRNHFFADSKVISPSLGGWNRATVIGIALRDRGEDEQLLVLCSASLLHFVCLGGPGRAPGAVARPTSLRLQHRVPRCLALSQTSKAVVVAGDGPGACAAGPISFSVWRIMEQARPADTTAKLIMSSGGPSPGGSRCSPSGLVQGLWSISLSPCGRFAAVAGGPAVGLRLFGMEDGAPIDPLREFAGATCSPSKDAAALASESVSCCWWGHRLLAVSTASGKVAAGRLPGLDDVLARQGPQLFSAGATLAASGKRLFVLDPVSSAPRDDGDSGEPENSAGPTAAWRLVCFVQRTPEEMLGIHIRDGRWDAALALAADQCLGTDRVHMARWRSEEVSADSIREILSLVEDRAWVVGECLGRLAPSVEMQRELILFGLAQTEPNGSAWQSMGEGQDAAFARLRLLNHLERLETWAALWPRGRSLAAFAAFRDADMFEAACGFAATGQLTALQVLFQRHPAALAPFQLLVLDRIPESVDPKLYREILPRPNSALPAAETREADWIENAETAAWLEAQGRCDLMTEGLLQSTRGCPPLGAEAVAEWFESRARAIEGRAGQAAHALALVRLGLEAGAGTEGGRLACLESLLLEVVSISRRPAAGSAMEAWALELREYEAMEKEQQLRLLIWGSDPSNMAEVVAEQIAPFAKRIGCVGSESVFTILAAMLEAEAEQGNLGWCESFLSCPQTAAVLSMSGSQLLELAVATVYACRATDRWEGMRSLLDNAAAAAEACLEADGSSWERAMQAAAALRGHLRIGELLAGHGPATSFPAAAVRDMLPKETARAVRTLLASTVRSEASRRDSTWASLWRELEEMLACGLRGVDRTWLGVELCRALLRAGKFGLARSYLQGGACVAFSDAVIEAVVMSCGREYLLNATSMGSSEIRDAIACFDLLPRGSQAAAKERSTISLLNRLPSFGVELLPIQYSQVSDPMEVVRMVLDARSHAFRRADEILQLAPLLGFDGREDSMEVTLAIAERALAAAAAPEAAAEDIEQAAGLCLGLAAKGYGPAWKLCADASGSLAARLTPGQRQELLAFAAGHCPGDQVASITADLRAAVASCGAPAGGEMASGAWGTASAPSLLVKAINSAEGLQSWHGGKSQRGGRLLLNTAENTLALAGLVLAEEEGRPADIAEYAAQGRSYAGARLSRLLGLMAESMRVLQAVQGDRGKDILGGAAAMSPWELLEQAQDSSSALETLGDASEAAEALASARLLASRLGSASDATRVAAVLGSSLNERLFASGDSDYQRQVVLRIAEAAAKTGQSDRAALNEALALGGKYGMSRDSILASHVLSLACSAEPQSEEALSVHLAEITGQTCDMLADIEKSLRETTGTDHVTIANLARLAACVFEASAGSEGGDAARPELALKHRKAADLSDFLTRLGGSGLAMDAFSLVGEPLMSIVSTPQQGEHLSVPPHGRRLGPGAGCATALRAVYDSISPGTGVESLGSLLESYPLSAADMDSADVNGWISRSGAYALHIAKAAAEGDPDCGKSVDWEASPGLSLLFELLGFLSAPHLAAAAGFVVFGDASGLPEGLRDLQSLSLAPSSALKALRCIVGQFQKLSAQKAPLGKGDSSHGSDVVALAAPFVAAERQLSALELAGQTATLPAEFLRAAERAALKPSSGDSAAAWPAAELLARLVDARAGARALVDVAGCMPSDGEEPLALVESTLCALLDEALSSLAEVDAVPERVESVVAALDEPPEGIDLNPLRTSVWCRLRSSVTGAGAGNAGILNLCGSLVPGAVPGASSAAGPARWGEWTPPSPSDAVALLQGRTVAVLRAAWPNAHEIVSKEDVSGTDAACQLCQRLLEPEAGASQRQAQLSTLSSCMVSVWRYGFVWGVTESEPSLSPLHPAWVGVLKASVRDGEGSSDALQLLETAEQGGVHLLTREEAASVISAALDAKRCGDASCMALALPLPDIQQEGVRIAASQGLSPGEEERRCALPLLCLALRRGLVDQLVDTACWGAVVRATAELPLHPAACEPGNPGGSQKAVGSSGTVFPHLVAALVLANKPGLAAAMLVERACVHPALCSFGGALAVAQSYLMACERTRLVDAPLMDRHLRALPLTIAELRERLQATCAEAHRALVGHRE